VRITLLCDDTAGRRGLVGEHGFSALVEAGDLRVLVDTGPPGYDLPGRAEALGLSLAGLDAVVLTHGHYDHVGGLEALLAATGSQKVLAHPLLFRERFARRGSGDLREIGPPLSREEYERRGASFLLEDRPWALGQCLTTTGQLPPVASDAPSASLLMRDGDLTVADDFADEIALVVDLPGGALVINGCAHKGLPAAVARSSELASSGRVSALLGGTHLVGLDDEAVASVAEHLNALGVEALVPCHCTGARALAVLMQAFRGQVLAAATGDVFTAGGPGGIRLVAAPSQP
jgi:7,8-dihydropterin-6-yl-methyl-4-(beta-D-ribofuranosyl)aminobenzene 5'-phosphate synthase